MDYIKTTDDNSKEILESKFIVLYDCLRKVVSPHFSCLPILKKKYTVLSNKKSSTGKLISLY